MYRFNHSLLVEYRLEDTFKYNKCIGSIQILCPAPVHLANLNTTNVSVQLYQLLHLSRLHGNLNTTNVSVQSSQQNNRGVIMLFKYNKCIGSIKQL